MTGTANFEEKDLFKIGGPCIIYVNDVNSPQGIWWGTIRNIEEQGSGSFKYLQIIAEITGGRFYINGQPVYSDEYKGKIPSVNYTIYPDIPSIRSLIQRNIDIAKDSNDKVRELRIFKQYHADTMSALGRK